MITDREFSRSFSSFWNDTIPFCEAFIRNLNSAYADSFSRPVPHRTSVNRRALVNDLASSIFETSSISQVSASEIYANQKVLNRICKATHQRIKSLEFASEAFPPPNIVEQLEALDIAKRLELYFLSVPRENRVFRPRFSGCGVLDMCEGDVFCTDTLTLYEIKAGDRNFRGPDLRQVLIYAALAIESGQYNIAHIGLLNPRHGTHFKMSLEELCMRLSGSHANDVLGRIIAFVSSGSASI